MISILLDCSESIVTESDVVLDGSPLYPLRYSIELRPKGGTRTDRRDTRENHQVPRILRIHHSLRHWKSCDNQSKRTLGIRLRYVKSKDIQMKELKFGSGLSI